MKTKSLEGKRTELIYWEQNGEKKVEKVSWSQIVEEIQQGESLWNWRESKTPYGYMRCTVFRVQDGYMVVKEWVPHFGYSWDEVEVYFITPS